MTYIEATHKITNLVQSHFLWIDQSHGILEIKVALAIEIEAHVSLLDNSTVDQIGDGTVSDLLLREVGKEKIEIGRNIGLRSVLDNAIAVLLALSGALSNLVQSLQTVRHDLLITLFKLSDELRLVDPLA